MRVFLHIIFWGNMLGVLSAAIHLLGDYPRTDTIKMGEDVLRLIGAIGLGGVAAALLWAS